MYIILIIFREDFKLASKMLIKNKNYILLITGSALSLGSFTGGIIVSISFYVSPFGFSESEISKMLAIIPLTAGFGIYVA